MEKLKIQFVQLGHNCWEDCIPPESVLQAKPNLRGRSYSPNLADYFDCKVWRNVLERMKKNGLNAVLIDLADGIRYKSRPEIGLHDALTIPEFRDELQFCRDLGLEPFPKLNFSSCHDAWLKEYERMLSTPAYYACCKDLIEEVCELFGGPRFFHLGMDEEDYPNQAYYNFVAIRQNSLWWHDLNFLVQTALDAGSRPWIWSDKIWDTPLEEFQANMPRSAVQSNWYYGKSFSLNPGENRSARCVQAFLDLDRLGYDQIPCGSNHSNLENYPGLVRFCEERLGHVLGYMTAPWGGSNRQREAHLLAGADNAGEGNRFIRTGGSLFNRT